MKLESGIFCPRSSMYGNLGGLARIARQELMRHIDHAQIGQHLGDEGLASGMPNVGPNP